jgi:formylglycine-generating enzyme required for sulfatase activity
MGDENGEPDEKPATPVRFEKGFWMGKTEITNGQYAVFDLTHDSRVESKHDYQFGVHGFPVNGSQQPVVRVSWKRAMAFCEWLSEKTGEAFALPTEAQWEYACRAGTSAPLFCGGLDDDFSRFANLGDAMLSGFVSNPYTVFDPYPNPNRYDDWVPKEERFTDGGFVTTAAGTYKPNIWGLHDMHGNAWEWTRSSYRPYPYVADDGRNDMTAADEKVVRGGSWYDRPKRCRSAYRLAYRPYQSVFNVGFRVVLETDDLPTSLQ